VSREFGIPAIVGVHEASSKIPDGALVLLDADTGFIEIINE
jgi:phosphohistidine swiveling domain-containing protein